MAQKTFDPSKLARAMQKSRLTLRDYREKRVEAVRQYVGSGWSEWGTDKVNPINLLGLYVQIVGRSLIAKNPRVMLSTFEQSQKPTIAKIEKWANSEIERMRLATTLQRIVLDALFSIGIAKIALASPADSSIAGWQTKAGQPFCERVDLDDFVFDIHARSFEEVGFIGHRYRAPLDVVKEDRSFSAARKDLTASDDKFYNTEGDERINVMGRGYYSNQEEYDDFVDLWEIYDPRRMAVFTFVADATSGLINDRTKPLRAQRWIGPETGPIRILGYNTVPGNPMPKGQIPDLVPMAIAMNELVRKLLRQAERQKEVLLVSNARTETGERTRSANDGDLIQCDSPQDVTAVSYGGPNAQNFSMSMAVKDWFSWIAGNLDMMGGLSPQSKTATQDKMLEANASKGITDLQETTVAFTADVCKDLIWFWHHHPVNKMDSSYSHPGAPNATITRRATPQDRQQIPWSELQFKIDPYSIQFSTPESRLQMLNAVVQQVIIPGTPLLQSQGMQFDFGAYLSKVGHLGDMPDLQDVVSVSAPPAENQDPGAQKQADPSAPAKPATTSRNYTRTSQGGNTPQSRQAAQMNAAASQGKAGGNPSAAPMGGMS